MDNCRYSSLLTVSIWIISGRFFEAGALHLQFAFPIFDRPQTRVLLTHSLNKFPNQPEFAFLSKIFTFSSNKDREIWKNEKTTLRFNSSRARRGKKETEERKGCSGGLPVQGETELWRLYSDFSEVCLVRRYSHS